MVEIQSKGPLSAVKKCLKYIGVGSHYAIVQCIYTKGMGEQSIDIQGLHNKKRGGSEQGVAANAQGDHDIGPKSQSDSNLDNGGKGKE